MVRGFVWPMSYRDLRSKRRYLIKLDLTWLFQSQTSPRLPLFRKTLFNAVQHAIPDFKFAGFSLRTFIFRRFIELSKAYLTVNPEMTRHAKRWFL